MILSNTAATTRRPAVATRLTLELPTLPVAHAQALAMLARHDIAASDLAAIVEGDPALTAAVLRAANSAASAPLAQIRTANDAIVRIGLSITRRIVAGAALGSSFTDLGRSGLDVNEMWRHVVACALLADATAWADGPRTEAFTAGLLHDVGRLAMAAQDPERYATVVARVHAGEDARTAESAAFGVDHVEWGTEIGDAWGFPDAVADAIANHHDGGEGPLAWVTWNGRRIAGDIGIGDGMLPPDEAEAEPDPEDAAIVEVAGGGESLDSQIEWYRGAFAAAA